MVDGEQWISQLRRDLGKLERQHRRGEELKLARRPRRSAPEQPVNAVWLGHRYPRVPVLGVAAADFSTLDLAFRRAAYAALRGRSAELFAETDTRIPLRLGLQLRGTRDGSLESLLDAPAWIVGALASVPATALINLVTLLSWREAIRVRLRQLVLTDEEQRALSVAAREAPSLPEPEDVPGPSYPHELPRRAGRPVPVDPGPDAVPSQGALPDDVLERLASTDPVVDVDIGDIHIRGMRPEVEVVVQQGDRITAVSIRAPTR